MRNIFKKLSFFYFLPIFYLYAGSMSWLEIPERAEIMGLAGMNAAENPASLPFLRNIHFDFSSGYWFLDLKDSSFALRSKWIAIYLRTLKINDEERDIEGNKISDFSSSFKLFSLETGFRIFTSFSLGLRYEKVKETLYQDFFGRATLFSFGFLYVPSYAWKYGVLFSHFGGKTKYENVDEKFSPPFTTKIGIENQQGRLRFLVGIDFPQKERLWIRWGLEFSAFRALSLRWGAIYQDFFDFTFGLGIIWKNFIFDFALYPQADLGVAQKFDLSIKF